MKQYKKPLLQSAFDLQSRISNQVKQNFLNVFITQRNSERDKSYARYNFAFVIAEFMGWLEVIRQEIVFISGQEDSVLLSSLIDAIKCVFCGGFLAASCHVILPVSCPAVLPVPGLLLLVLARWETQSSTP